MRIPIFLLFLVYSITAIAQGNYVLVWSDEFDGNGAIDSEKWHHQTILPNGDSWYNGEIQHYTNRVENSEVSNGTLKIRAIRETFTDQGVTKEFTSARLNSKFAFTYGKIEVRAKLPTGIGTWPAIWTLGQNIIETGGYWSDAFGTVIWPACGEIDVMEHWGINQDFIQSAIHSPSSFGDTQNKGGQIIAGVSDEFHTYTMEWTEEKIEFSVDDSVHYTYEPSVQNPDTWPFTGNQYILLNVAILPDILPTYTESAMEIDYVRVYQDDILGNEDPFANALSIFPNPAKDQITVSVPSEFLGAALKLYSVSGQALYANSIDEVNSRIDLSSLPSGMYFIKIEKGERVFSEPFVK